MAHTCIECGSICYCGGDIDDIEFEEAPITCNHKCDPADEGDADDYDLDLEDEP